MCGQEQAFKKWATEVFHVSRLKLIYLKRSIYFTFRIYGFLSKKLLYYRFECVSELYKTYSDSFSKSPKTSKNKLRVERKYP